MPLEVSKPKEFRKQVGLREQSFVGAKRELMETLTERTKAQIKEQLPNNNAQCITSEMNVPSTIHIGDIWEHQIRSVRCLFFSNIGKKRCRHLNLHIPGKSH